MIEIKNCLPEELDFQKKLKEHRAISEEYAMQLFQGIIFEIESLDELPHGNTYFDAQEDCLIIVQKAMEKMKDALQKL